MRPGLVLLLAGLLLSGCATMRKLAQVERPDLRLDQVLISRSTTPTPWPLTWPASTTTWPSRAIRCCRGAGTSPCAWKPTATR